VDLRPPGGIIEYFWYRNLSTKRGIVQSIAFGVLFYLILQFESIGLFSTESGKTDLEN